MGIYQNRTGGHATRQKFILSVTNTQMQGQSILKRATNESGKDSYLEAQKKVTALKAKNKIEARKLLLNPDYFPSRSSRREWILSKPPLESIATTSPGISMV